MFSQFCVQFFHVLLELKCNCLGQMALRKQIYDWLGQRPELFPVLKGKFNF